MEKRFSLTHKAPQHEYLQYPPARAVSSTALTSTSMSVRSTEKDLMHGLNDRLAGFIDKVHQLERQNEQLEKEIEEIRWKAKPAARLEEEYAPELRKMRQMVQEISQQKHQIEIEHQNLEDELLKLKRQHEEETRGRSDAERSMILLKKDINAAYQAKLHLDKKAQALVDEIDFLKRNHEAEMSEMRDQIESAQVSVRAHGFGDPAVTAALRDIRAQLEGHTVSDLQQVGETFRSQFAKLTEAAEIRREALKVSQQEIQEYRRRLQAKNIELDCAKGTSEALEKQLHEVEDRHKEEMIHYQDTVKELENELISCKFDMSGYLREYQDLLNVKMALDVEILSYRKLLCGEEARLSSMSDSHISLPYIYHQSPVYTLPCLSRPGAPYRRAEPQYKFVEEIITETTREIEMSEFEETGSEATDGGREEEEHEKRGRGGGEEEEDGDKDGGEDEGEQVYDGEQDQVDLVNGGGDESPVEGEDDGIRRETEDSKGDCSIDKSFESKDLISEKLDEKKREEHQNEADINDHQDLPSKPGVPKKENKPDGGEKGKSVDENSGIESFKVCKTQEQSSDHVKDKGPTLASETPDTSNKAPESSSTTKNEGKKNTQSEAEGVEDKVAKCTQGATDDNKGLDKDSSLKTDERGPSEDKDKKDLEKKKQSQGKSEKKEGSKATT